MPNIYEQQVRPPTEPPSAIEQWPGYHREQPVLGKTIAEMGLEWLDELDAAGFLNAETQFINALQELRGKYAADQDFDTIQQRWQADVETAASKIAESNRLSAGAANQLQARFDRRSVLAASDIDTIVTLKRKDAIRSRIYEQIEAKIATAVDDPGQTATMMYEIDVLLDSPTALGSMDREEIAAQKAQIGDKIQRNSINAAIYKGQIDMALGLIESSDLNPAEKISLRDKANRQKIFEDIDYIARARQFELELLNDLDKGELSVERLEQPDVLIAFGPETEKQRTKWKERIENKLVKTPKPNWKSYVNLQDEIVDSWWGRKTKDETLQSVTEQRYDKLKLDDGQYANLRQLLDKDYPNWLLASLQQSLDYGKGRTSSRIGIAWGEDHQRYAAFSSALFSWLDQQYVEGKGYTVGTETIFTKAMELASYFGQVKDYSEFGEKTDRVRVRLPDGTVGTIPRTNLEKAREVPGVKILER